MIYMNLFFFLVNCVYISYESIIHSWCRTLVQFVVELKVKAPSCVIYEHFGYYLTHWGRVTHICGSKLTIIGSDDGLSPGWRQAIIWTNGGILLIRTFRTHFSEIISEILTFHSRNCISKCRQENRGHLIPASMCWDWNKIILLLRYFS